MKKEIKVEIPIIPNFIKIGEVLLGIEQFFEKELRQVGKEWTEELIKVSLKRRTIG